MPSFIQNDKLAVTFANLGKNDLLLERFSGQERLSGLFQFELDMLAERQTAIPFDKIIGQPVTVRLTGLAGSIRYFNGMISELSEGGLVVGNDGRQTFIRYRAVMVPAVFKLSKRLQSRIFQDTSIKTILQTVFKGFDVDMQGLTESFPPRNYCVQYEESDLAFASRLMEAEGIYYSFKHTEKGHQMVFSSGKPTTQPLEVSYDPVSENQNSERIDLLDKKQQLTSGTFTVWDYHFQDANSNLNATVKVPPPVSVGQVSHSFNIGGNSDLDDYQHGDFAHHFDAVTKQGSANSQGLDKLHEKNTNRATLRMERSIAQALTLNGQSTCPGFAAGVLVEVKNHFRGPIKLLVTEVRHEASLEGAFTMKGSGPHLTYSNEFQSIPADTQYRPQLDTPRPRILGCQTALVVAADNNDLSTEPLGRVQVQFFWDCWGQSTSKFADGNLAGGYQFWENQRAGANSKSCWLRVSQAWAGSRFGALFTPRKGMEVIVQFADGDPDRPIITGCAYNSLNAPPFNLPDQAEVSGWKTKTPGGDDNCFNGLAFYDTKDDEYLMLQSEKTLIIRTEGDLVFDVGGCILQNHNGNVRQTVGAMPGSGSGDGGGDDTAAAEQPEPGGGNSGPSPTPVMAVPAHPASASADASNAPVVLISSGTGGGDPNAPATQQDVKDAIAADKVKQQNANKPWKITNSGFVTGWTNDWTSAWGVSTKATVGASASVTMPLKFDVIVDPITVAEAVLGTFQSAKSTPDPTKAGAAATVFGLLKGLVAGKRAISLCNTSELILGQKTEVLLTGKNAWELGGYQEDPADGKGLLKATAKKALAIGSCVVGTLVTAELLTMGGFPEITGNTSASNITSSALAWAIMGECMILQGVLAGYCMKAYRLLDVFAETEKATATAAKLKDATTTVKTAKTEVENIVGDVLATRELNDGMTVRRTAQTFDTSVTDSIAFKAGGNANQFSVMKMNRLAFEAGGIGAAGAGWIKAREDSVLIDVKIVGSTAQIEITPDSITLSIGDGLTDTTSIKMTQQGIVLNAPKVSITAPGGLEIKAPTTLTGKMGITGDTSIDGRLKLTGSLSVTGNSAFNGRTTTAGPWTFFG